MKSILRLTLAVLIGSWTASAAPQEKAANSRAVFTLAPLQDGQYAPWRELNDGRTYFAGEVTTIRSGEFRYTYFTDALVEESIDRDFTGKVKVFPDHIYLDHPGVPFPYRICGVLNGDHVMITWEGLQEWKRFRKIRPHHILYLQKESKAAQPGATDNPDDAQ